MLADWHRELISPERAIMITGDCVVRSGFRHPDPSTWLVVLECNDCERVIVELSKSVETLDAPGERRESSYPYTVETLLSAVLRHRVTHHEEVLSGDRTVGVDVAG
jgi:hypothetical protein